MSTNVVKFDLQSLFADEIFGLSCLATSKPLRDDFAILLHRQAVIACG